MGAVAVAGTAMSVLPKVAAASAAIQTVAGAGLSIYQGMQQNAASKAQADITRSYGQIQQFEANRQALRIEDEGHRFAQKQKLMYIGSGVEYGGSAVITIAQTKKWAAEEAKAKRARGTALMDYANRTAVIQEGKGRAALIGGFASGAEKIISYGTSAGSFLSAQNELNRGVQ